MAMHNPPNLGPTSAPVSEWDRNIRRSTPKPFDHEPHQQGRRLQFEATRNQARVYQVQRRYLGIGAAILEPNSEVILPKPITANALLTRIVGVEEGDRVELLPEQTFVGYRSTVTKPEHVFIYRRSPMQQDFVIQPGRIVRIVIKTTKTVALG